MADPRTALDAIGKLADTEIDIGSAAIQLARIDAPGADWEAAEQHLSLIARKAAALDEQGLVSRAKALAGLLAGEMGYEGDSRTYDDIANANLIRVTERRRGLPVALGIVWMHAARAAGWECHGVDFPAHFLIALDGTRTQVVIDVFRGGRILPVRDLRELLQQVEGPDAALRTGLLRPMSTRRVLLRLQNNIMTRRLAAGDTQGGLICLEDMLRIAPEQAELWRQAGSLNERLDRIAKARLCYEQYLGLVPEGRVAEALRLQLAQLRSRPD
jgi:hypothetical protein